MRSLSGEIHSGRGIFDSSTRIALFEAGLGGGEDLGELGERRRCGDELRGPSL